MSERRESFDQVVHSAGGTRALVGFTVCLARGAVDAVGPAGQPPGRLDDGGELQVKSLPWPISPARVDRRSDALPEETAVAE